VSSAFYTTPDAAAEFLDNAVERDGLANHWRESYVCETSKSMKALGLAVSRRAVEISHLLTVMELAGSPLQAVWAAS
jgi:hypothetical protein